MIKKAEQILGDAFGALVHPSIIEGTPAFTAHRYFIGTRLAMAVLGVIALSLFTIMPQIVTSNLHYLGVIFLFQAVVALGVSRLGGFRAGIFLSLLSLSLIPVLAGGPASLALLMPLILEGALLQGPRGAVIYVISLAASAIVSFFTGPVVSPLAMMLFSACGLTGLAFGVFFALDLIVGADRRATREEDRWRGATALVDGGLARHDVSGKIKGANEKFCRFLGIDAETLSDRSVIERLHLSSAPLFLKALSDASHGAHSVDVHIRIRAEAGAEGHDASDPYRDAIVRFQRVTPGGKGDDGEIFALYRAAPAPLVQRKADKVETTTFALQRLGHELRTPLSAIVGFTDCLADPNLMADQESRRQDYVRLISVSAHHMLDLVDGLSQGKVPQEAEDRFDLAAILNETLAMIAPDAAQKGTEIRAHIAPHLPRMIGHRSGIRQVALNLLSNAIKFAPQGKVTVTLRQEGPMLALTIADDGAGVEIDELPRLTEPRFRGRSSRSAQIEGQGLGLSIVREIVAHHDGRLALDSRPGEGLSATVHFPLEPQAQEVYHTTRRVMAGGRRYA